MANDIITQLQARNETLTQAIARYGSLNANTLHSLSTEQRKMTQLTQQLTDSAFRREENGQQRVELLEKSQRFAGQFGKLLTIDAPDWALPYDFQDKMVDMARKGGMDNGTRDALSLSLRDWSMDFNQDQQALQDAASSMMEGGITSLQDLSRYMPDIAKAATATRDSAESWAQAAIATRSQLNIDPADFRSAQNMLSSVSKNSGISVAEQTQWIAHFAPETMATGTEGLATLAATMQIAMQNAPNAAVAAEHYDHFLQATFSKKTDSWFASQGVDLRGSLLEHQQNGVGVTEAMTHIVQMQLDKMNPQILDALKQTMKIEDLAARGDALKAVSTQFNLNAMFDDAQALEFITPMLASMDEYRQLKADAMQATSQSLIDDDFTARMASSKEQTKALQLALNDLWLTVGSQLLPAVGELALTITPLVRQFSAWLRENPALVQGIAKMAGAIWLFNGALNILRLGANLIASPFINLIDIFLKVKASLVLGGGVSNALTFLKSLGNGAKTLATLLGGQLVSALKWVGQAFIWLGRALLMNPIGLTITAIAGAAYLIYRYWEPLCAFFSGVWAQIKTAFDGGLAGITGLIYDWSPLGVFYRAFASVMDWFGIELPASFSEFGSNLLNSLIDGILNALPFLKDAIAQIKDQIPDWAKSTLGIRIEKPVAVAPLPGVAGMLLSHPVSPPATKTPATSLALAEKSAATSLPRPPRAPGNVQVHFSPQVTVQGNGANAAGDVHNVLALSRRELERMVNDIMVQKQRREYA